VKDPKNEEQLRLELHSKRGQLKGKREKEICFFSFPSKHRNKKQEKKFNEKLKQTKYLETTAGSPNTTL
jgi:hypothetical protein